MSEQKVLYCRVCLIEQPVYPMAGHKIGEMDLGCTVCKTQISRLKKNVLGAWELDPTFYK